MRAAQSLKGTFTFSRKIKRWTNSRYSGHPSWPVVHRDRDAPYCRCNGCLPQCTILECLCIRMLAMASAYWSAQPRDSTYQWKLPLSSGTLYWKRKPQVRLLVSTVTLRWPTSACHYVYWSVRSATSAALVITVLCAVGSEGCLDICCLFAFWFFVKSWTYSLCPLRINFFLWHVRCTI